MGLDDLLGLDGSYFSLRKDHHGPQFYLQRRRQLLLTKFSSADPEVSITSPQLTPQYLKMRKKLLEQSFGKPPRSRANSRQSSSISMFSDSDSQRPGETHPHEHHPIEAPLSSVMLAPASSAHASAALTGSASLGQNYAFIGMHHIFDQHSQPVPVVRFANNDKRLVACCSMDGTISICQVLPDGQVLKTLQGHKKGVTDFQWSAANELILSTSLDKTIRIWDVKSGNCLRVIVDVAEGLCCLFHPENNNIFVVGNRKNEVKTYNLSTGKTAREKMTQIGAPVTAMTFDQSGQYLYAGNDRGELFTLRFSSSTGEIQRLSKFVASKRVISSLSFSSWYNREMRDPSLLVSCKENVIKLYRIEDHTKFILKNTFRVQNHFSDSKSTFCPLMSFLEGACIATASEDMSVYVFNVINKEKPLINRLQGHSTPVLGICWAYDESLLASSAADGTVIIWKRAPLVPEGASEVGEAEGGNAGAPRTEKKHPPPLPQSPSDKDFTIDSEDHLHVLRSEAGDSTEPDTVNSAT